MNNKTKIIQYSDNNQMTIKQQQNSLFELSRAWTKKTYLKLNPFKKLIYSLIFPITL